tara:strand:- start:1535 stop:5149 length:3615 start_codon:yes stop_codon:yes gene_type:complete
MNKDLDDRLVPKGEYRNAKNLSVAKSEGQDVGALQNILGNNLVSNFILPTETYGVEIIGHFMDVRNNRIIVFMTNYVDTSNDALSNFSPAGAYHAIGVYDVTSAVSSIVVTGRFLNFSKTQEMYGVNMIDSLLFWTDNRNQPRKINLTTAIGNNSYYTSEDHISVSKYYPYQTIDLITNEVVGLVGLPVPGSGYTTTTNVATSGGTGVGLTLNLVLGGGGAVNIAFVNNPGIGYTNGDVVNIIEPFVGGGSGATVTLTVESASTMRDVVSDFLPDGTTNNPYRQPTGTIDPITWPGDAEYLKEKFVRFSYRFKFDDGEYSLIAPFTQTCFIPKQDGYFIGDDDAKTFKSTEVGFMQNKVNDIKLIINSPTGDWNDIDDALKVKEVDILYKEAGQNTIKIVDTITNDELNLVNSTYLTYDYLSSKPWKTLPTSEILRVSDQVPVRAFAQEIAGDRVIYGNYINKPTPPSTINYSLNISEKDVNTQIEYQNQNLKQNRSYQVGIVLSDRYGRQSTVILSSLDDNPGSSSIKGSSIFNKFKESPFSQYSAGSLLSAGDVWDGDNLEMTFWDTISSTRDNNTGTPGLYNATTNPLGWYTYKIVVKQQEQDYYNIYFPGILNGYIDGDGAGTAATADEPVCHFVLQGDNINKVPRDLSLVGPNQNIFRTGRPSIQQDPSYYKFVDSSGIGFSVDPSSEEGERLLKERDRERDLDSGSQITNASVKLSLRLNNTIGATALLPTTQQFYPDTRVDTVTTIGTGSELGLWDPSAIPPFNTANVFYSYENNPYVAKENVLSQTVYPGAVGPSALATKVGLKGPHPNSGRFNFTVTKSGTAGTGYIGGSKNIPCNIPSISGAGSGFLINIDTDSGGGSGGAPALMSIADVGTGWDMLSPASGGSPITGCTITGAGDGLAEFTLSWTKTPFSGQMMPSLAVYETEPLESKLNIYWETSSNGLISELNTAVQSGDVTTPVGFIGTGLNPIEYMQNESNGIGTRITTNPALFATNVSGNIISGPITFTLDSVIDGYSVDRASDFTLEDAPVGYPDGFKLKTNAFFVCDYDNLANNTFTFNINVNAPSATYGSDGTFIDRQVSLGPYTLENIAPLFNAYPTLFLYSYPNSSIGTWSAQNGAGGANPLRAQGLNWEIVDFYTRLPIPQLYFVPTGNLGEMNIFVDNSVTAGQVYSFEVIVTDGLGVPSLTRPIHELTIS